MAELSRLLNIVKMALFVSLVLLLVTYQVSAAPGRDKVTEGTELVSAFLIHRHGDKIPSEQILSMVQLDANVEEVIAQWGYGQLTNVGRQRAYELGKFIRRRYDELLSPVFNRSEIYVRSTDSTRTKMTVLTALAAVFPATGDTWSEDVNWVPVPYTTVPAKWDFNEATLNCPVLTTAMNTLMYSSSPNMDQYTDVLTKLTAITGIDVSQAPGFVFGFYDLYVSLISLGVDLGDVINELMPGLAAASREATDIIYGNENYIALNAGPLLNEFFSASAAAIAGENAPPIRIYSAHDANVYGFEAVIQVYPRQGQPKYASALSLEVRRVIKTGKYVVLPVYLPSPGEPEMYLPVKGCKNILCDYDTFYDITSQYALEEDAWRTKCGFSSDMEFDTSDLD